MHTNIALKLADNLTSGKYSKGVGQLRSQTETFCVIGVLTDMFVMEGHGQWVRDNYGRWGILEDGLVNSISITDSVAEWAGISPEDKEVTIPGGKTLMELNDELLYSFGDVARELREAYAPS